MTSSQTTNIVTSSLHTYGCYILKAKFAKFVVKSVNAQQKIVVKSVNAQQKYAALFVIQWYTIFVVRNRGCMYVSKCDGKAIEMEREQATEATDNRGSTAGWENLVDEGIRETLLYGYCIY